VISTQITVIRRVLVHMLEVDEIKPVPYVPVSHAFVEAFGIYYNEHRVHQSLSGVATTTTLAVEIVTPHIAAPVACLPEAHLQYKSADN
jgi:hypothetical protein